MVSFIVRELSGDIILILCPSNLLLSTLVSNLYFTEIRFKILSFQTFTLELLPNLMEKTSEILDLASESNCNTLLWGKGSMFMGAERKYDYWI